MYRGGTPLRRGLATFAAIVSMGATLVTGGATATAAGGRLLSPPTAPGGARIGPGAVPRRAAGDGIAASRDLPMGRPRQLGRMGQGGHRLRRQGQRLDARLRREAGRHRAVQARHGPDAEVPGPGSGQGVRARRRRRSGDHVHRPRPDADLLQVGEHRGAAWLDATFPRRSVHAGSGGDDGRPALGPDRCPRHEEHRAAARRAAHARRGTLPDTRTVRRAHARTPTRAPLQQQQRGDGRRAEESAHARSGRLLPLQGRHASLVGGAVGQRAVRRHRAPQDGTEASGDRALGREVRRSPVRVGRRVGRGEPARPPSADSRSPGSTARASPGGSCEPTTAAHGTCTRHVRTRGGRSLSGRRPTWPASAPSSTAACSRGT